MRMLSGLILGALLTVGGAYLHDVNIAPVPGGPGPMPPGAVTQGQIVNWDVFGAVARQGANAARRKWDAVVGN